MVWDCEVVEVCEESISVCRMFDYGNTVSTISVNLDSPDYQAFESTLDIENGVKPLYFTFNGTGKFDFGYIEF